MERLPLAQGMIPGSWDRVPHWAPRGEPASPAYVSASLSGSLSCIKKYNLKKKKKRTQGRCFLEMHPRDRYGTKPVIAPQTPSNGRQVSSTRVGGQ